MPGLKYGTFLAGTTTPCPVFGLRPVRLPRLRMRKLPKPRSSILSPRCRASTIDEKRIERPEDHFKPGDVFPMKIIKVQEGEKKIGLSIRAVKADEFAQDFKTYRETTGSDRSTLGDVFRAAQAAAAAREKEEEEGDEKE